MAPIQMGQKAIVMRVIAHISKSYQYANGSLSFYPINSFKIAMGNGNTCVWDESCTCDKGNR